jgi:hypothetical protein
LAGEKLRAVIAHEFGYIWIFTHHPFFQTEALTNQKALAAPPRQPDLPAHASSDGASWYAATASGTATINTATVQARMFVFVIASPPDS